MVFPHLFGMQEDDLDANAFQRHLQNDQSMRSIPNQANLQNPFQTLTQGQQQAGNSLQSMFQQQQQQQQHQQQSNNPMMQMMGSQSHQQFGSNSFSQASSGMSQGNSLLNRFAGQLSSSFSDPQQQLSASLLGGNANSFLDNSRGNEASLLAGFSQQQGGGGNIQSNLRQLEMANDLLVAQRRLSMGLGTSSNGNATGGSSGFASNMFDDFGATGKNSFGNAGSSSGLDSLQGTDASNLEGLMASQLQQQQQQLSLQHQLMMVAAQQQQQGDSARRGSFGGGIGGMGGMDPSLSMQLSMMGQQSMGGGMDLQAQQQQQLLAGKLQLQQQQQEHQDLQLQEHNQDSQDETGSIDAGVFGGGNARSGSVSAADEGKKPRKKKAKTFPEKLMQAITSHGEEDAVAWLPDGKSFVIVNDDLFVEQVLGKVFKESKYTSFVRKLHRWGFVRLTSGTGTDCFHHPLFQRGRRDLANKITCTPRDKDGNLKTPHRNMKPPSLAGVERFIRQKADAAVAMAEAKARNRDSDPGDSVPLQSTSGMGGMQSSMPSHLAMESLDKTPEPLGMGMHAMTGNLSGIGDMRKEIVKSMSSGNDESNANVFHSGFGQSEQADV